jgi:uncharacterized protein
MSSPLIDAHCHFYESQAVASWVKETCDIWEYGGTPSHPACPADGTLQDILDAASAAGLTYAVVVNCFSIDEWRDRLFHGLDDGLMLSEHTTAATHSLLGRLLMGYNEWLVRATAPFAGLVPFVALDPWVLPARQLDDHLAGLVANGARGAKIHPVAQRVRFTTDDALHLARLAARHGLPLVIHSGKAKGAVPFAEVASLTEIAKVPGLKLVLAHMGGAAWKQVPAFAADYPHVLFDISEILAWLGAPDAPDPAEMVRLIRQVGVGRVMFGSDFPWYSPADMIDVVAELPSLTQLERSAILGENAARHYSLH